jgi:hypothetical protein
MIVYRPEGAGAARKPAAAGGPGSRFRLVSVLSGA